MDFNKDIAMTVATGSPHARRRSRTGDRNPPTYDVRRTSEYLRRAGQVAAAFIDKNRLEEASKACARVAGEAGISTVEVPRAGEMSGMSAGALSKRLLPDDFLKTLPLGEHLADSMEGDTQ